MSGPSPHPSFLREVVVGLGLSLAAGAVAGALALVLPATSVSSSIITGVGLVYVLRVLAQANERTGRFVVLALWLLATGSIWILDGPPVTHLVLQVTAIWLVRSLYTYTTFVEAFADLGLSLLALCFAVWAAVRTESVFLAAWGFLLVSGMYVGLPGLIGRLCTKRTPGETQIDVNRTFREARSAADAALERIVAGD